MRRRLGLAAGLLVLGALLLLVAGGARASDPPGRVVAVGGGPLGQVVIDPAGARAYVTNPDRDRVEVVVLATGTLEAPIPVGSGPRGLDFSVDGTKLYVANSGGNDLSVVDLALRRDVARLAVPPGPYGGLAPFSVAVAANGTALVSVSTPGGSVAPVYQIDLSTGAARERTIDGGYLWTTHLRPSGDRSTIGVFEQSHNGTVALYRATTDTFTPAQHTRAELRGGALDRTGSMILTQAFVFDRDLVLEASFDTAAPGTINHAGTTGYWVEDSSVTVGDADRGLATATIALPEGRGNASGGAAITPDDSTLVVLTASGLSIVPVSAATPLPACVAPAPSGSLVPVCGAPLGEIVIDPSGTRAYATNSERNQVEVVRLADRRLEDPIPVGSRPVGIDLSPDGRTLYVANNGAHTVSVVDVATHREVRRILVPAGPSNHRPYGIAVANNGVALLSTMQQEPHGTPLLEIDLATDTVREAKPFWRDGNLITRARIEASGDRSRIGILQTDLSRSPIVRYDAATGTFAAKEYENFANRIGLDRTGSTILIDGRMVIDESMVQRASIYPGGMGAAVNGAGTVGYRVQASTIEVLDLARYLPSGSIGMDDGAAEYTGGSPLALTPDEATLVSATQSGFTIVAVGSATPLPPCPSTVTNFCGGPGHAALDASGTRAYITNPSRNRVEVLSLATRQLEAPIPVGSQPLALDLSADGRFLYVANYGANDISVVDVALRREVRRLTVPVDALNESPRSIAVANNGKALVTLDDGGSGWEPLYEVDLATGAFTARTDIPHGLIFTGTDLVASGDRSRILIGIANLSPGEVWTYRASDGAFADRHAIDTNLDSIAIDRTGSTILADEEILDGHLRRWATLTPNAAGSAAISADSRVAYRLRGEQVDVVDIGRAVVIGSIPFDEWVLGGEGGMVLTPDNATLLVLTYDGVMFLPTNAITPAPPCSGPPPVASVLSVCGQETIWGAESPVGEMVMDPTGQRVYASIPSRNQVDVVALATRTIEASIPVGSHPRGLDLSPDGTTLYVANFGGSDVSVVDLRQRREVRRITVPDLGDLVRPAFIAVANNGTALLMTKKAGSGWTDHMRQIDLATGTVVIREDLGELPITGGTTQFAPTADRSRVLVSVAGMLWSYDAPSNRFARSDPSVYGLYVDFDASGSTAMAGNFILNGDLSLRARLNGWQ
ncbi:MAG: YncE family protein, partial [Acidimicrobiales bacterium]